MGNEEIKCGEILYQIPQDLHISARTAELHAPQLWQTLADSGLGENAALALFLSLLLAPASDRASKRAMGKPDGDANTSEQVTHSPSRPNLQEVETSASPKVLDVWKHYADVLLSRDFSKHPHVLAAQE